MFDPTGWQSVLAWRMIDGDLRPTSEASFEPDKKEAPLSTSSSAGAPSPKPRL